MSYHSVTIEQVGIDLEQNPSTSRRIYAVTTAWSKWDVERAKPSEAYTLASEDYKILRWSSNDNVVPGDIIEATDWAYAAEMDAARDAELAAFLVGYREAQANRTPEQRAEELFEMRAAFGEGETVVNVITGERTKL